MALSAPFRLGTRGSPLALTQANMTRAALIAAHGWDDADVEIVVIKTTGDRVQDRALAEIGGKALWTKELDRALLQGEVDACVHSMKDVETIRPTPIALAAMLPRADVRDRLIGADSIDALKQGAVVGTSSPRRLAQLLNLRPDLSITLLRGNVDTRLAAVSGGTVDATLLAAAGLERLGKADGTAIPLDVMLPAPSQGAVGIEVRAEDERSRTIIDAINHADTCTCVGAERAMLAALGADCHSPVAALARIEGDQVVLRAQLFSMDGTDTVRGQAASAIGDIAMPEALAADLLARAPEPVARLFAGQ
ncbi:hydroxymethylbilane synthase [Sphingomonas sp. FW199]|uniref:hydroxymethylbilane synthase n=1 Tax=Sphingomonas sp. FW199 TaxID=3400217 RepID=UPI003CF76C0B